MKWVRGFSGRSRAGGRACRAGARRQAEEWAERAEERLPFGGAQAGGPGASQDLGGGRAHLDENICHSYLGYICGICIRACPLAGKALRADLWEKPILDPDYCVGCGLCEQACVHMPQAIRILPAKAARVLPAKAAGGGDRRQVGAHLPALAMDHVALGTLR